MFAGVDAGMAIARDEIYGPVVTVIPHESGTEAIAIANDSSYGLAGSVWTGDPERGMAIARRARVGTFGVSLYVPDIGAPWGGRKDGGMGSVSGPGGWPPTWPPSACSCRRWPTGRIQLDGREPDDEQATRLKENQPPANF